MDRNYSSNEADKSRRTIFIIAGAVALLLVAGLAVYLVTRSEPKPLSGPVDKKLEGGLRVGAPDFEKYRDLIKLDEPDAVSQGSLAGGVDMVLATTVRNFTGRTINGLEVKGIVTDLNDKTLKERTMVVIPSGSLPELENNKTARIKVIVPGFTKEEDKTRIDTGQAKIKMELTAVSLK